MARLSASKAMSDHVIKSEARARQEVVGAGRSRALKSADFLTERQHATAAAVPVLKPLTENTEIFGGKSAEIPLLPRLLTERQVADILGISVKTLRNWRVSGGPLPFVKISRAVRYEPEAVARLIAQQRRTSTSDTGKRA
jgi:hypothetical protein